MSGAAEDLYGALQLTLHRADLLDALEAAVPADSLRFGARVETLEMVEDGVTVRLADNTKLSFDVVVGADGIHSVVRAAMFGQEHPRFTGVVAYRAVIPRERLDLPHLRPNHVSEAQFGDTALAREWGRLGRRRLDLHEHETGAREALGTWLRRKQTISCCFDGGLKRPSKEIDTFLRWLGRSLKPVR
jgi:2-polyprenyl-6-methoxyphenol hydroxylase-like FAD-dependent oxidoreductase